VAQIPLLSGILADGTAEFRQSYPLNLEPVAIANKIGQEGQGQLRATAGVTAFVTGPGIDRGGAYWNDMLYRVMGTRLIRLRRAGTIDDLGDVGNDLGLNSPVTFAIGPDRLAIRSGDRLYYWDDITLAQVTDPQLGPCQDIIWIDGYFMSTDGTYVTVTELNDPFEIKPLKYGSAEEDPDPVTGLIKFRNESYVLGRHTIQVFRNVGGNGFPFITVRGATIPVGCVGPMAKCLYSDSFAFVGSARNEAIGVYIAGAGSANRISTRAIDDELAKVGDPAGIVLENRTNRSERRLFVHLPTKSLVFCLNATKAAQGEEIWYVAQSGAGKPYRPRFAVEAYNRIIVGDTESAQLGDLTDAVSTHFGESAQWRFDVGLVYNEGRGGILHAVELVGLPGRAPAGANGTAWLSLTRDGQSFTSERAISMGTAGDHGLRMQWRPRTNFRNYLGLRFRGFSPALPGFAAAEVKLSPLAA
jgi:hypothetical protein